MKLCEALLTLGNTEGVITIVDFHTPLALRFRRSLALIAITTPPPRNGKLSNLIEASIDNLAPPFHACVCVSVCNTVNANRSMSASPQKYPSNVAILKVTTTATYVGDAGEVLPTALFPSVSHLVTYSRRADPNTHVHQGANLPVTAASDGSSSSSVAANSALPEELCLLLRGRTVAVTVPTDIASTALVQLVNRLFSAALALGGVAIVSRPFAAAISVGQDKLRVLEFGLHCFTCSYVVAGVVEASATSRTLGLDSFVSAGLPSDAVAGSALRKFTEFPPGVQSKSSKGPLQRLLRQLPRESWSATTLLTGDALDDVAWYSAVRSWFADRSTCEKLLPAVDGVQNLVLEPAHSKPSVVDFTGASLLAALCKEEFESMVLTKSEFDKRGAEWVLWHAPGRAPDDAVGADAA